MNLKSIDYLKNFIIDLYDHPGVYKMFDEKKQILYIGKAKNLKKRLSDYINLSSLGERIKEFIKKLSYIEIIITKTEDEALILEAQLIRSLKPKYNILLKNDKPYNFILLNDNSEYPSFEYLKTKTLSSLKISNKKIFGPFFSSFQIRQILDLIYLNFNIRNCNEKTFRAHKKISKTCIQFDLKRCSGPCANKIQKIDYNKNLTQSINFLKGNIKSLIKDLENEMEKYSNDLNFEKAIIIRERIKSIKNFEDKKFLSADFDGDYITFCKYENQICITTCRIFGGNNYGLNSYFFNNFSSNQDELNEIISQFLSQLFLEIKPLDFIFLNISISNELRLEILKSSNIDINTKFINPLRGKKRKIIDDMCFHSLELIKIKLNKLKNNFSLIEQIKKWLNINKNIERIEVFDNSHIMGNFAIGSVIVFSSKDGFIKNEYRAYNIQKTNIPDDYAMLREVLFRRFGSLRHKIPDLIIIDGGYAHLRVAKSAIFEILGLDINEYEIISIAKGEKRNDGLETIFLKDESSISTNHEDPKIHFLQRLRDEAHRFGIKKHRFMREKSVFKVSKL